MVVLELSRDEADMLATMLTADLSDLRMEIAGTDKKEWRDGLKLREVFLNQLLGRLTPAAA
ncbi:MAG TPA: hypothetical protein VFH22_13085 [Rhodocyclaceae bacterium]|nr:hypothetical protein [Rhodocyclaceae bacterium]